MNLCIIMYACKSVGIVKGMAQLVWPLVMEVKELIRLTPTLKGIYLIYACARGGQGVY